MKFYPIKVDLSSKDKAIIGCRDRDNNEFYLYRGNHLLGPKARSICQKLSSMTEEEQIKIPEVAYLLDFIEKKRAKELKESQQKAEEETISQNISRRRDMTANQRDEASERHKSKHSQKSKTSSKKGNEAALFLSKEAEDLYRDGVIDKSTAEGIIIQAAEADLDKNFTRADAEEILETVKRATLNEARDVSLSLRRKRGKYSAIVDPNWKKKEAALQNQAPEKYTLPDDPNFLKEQVEEKQKKTEGLHLPLYVVEAIPGSHYVQLVDKKTNTIHDKYNIDAKLYPMQAQELAIKENKSILEAARLHKELQEEKEESNLEQEHAPIQKKDTIKLFVNELDELRNDEIIDDSLYAEGLEEAARYKNDKTVDEKKLASTVQRLADTGVKKNIEEAEVSRMRPKRELTYLEMKEKAKKDEAIKLKNIILEKKINKLKNIIEEHSPETVKSQQQWKNQEEQLEGLYPSFQREPLTPKNRRKNVRFNQDVVLESISNPDISSEQEESENYRDLPHIINNKNLKKELQINKNSLNELNKKLEKYNYNSKPERTPLELKKYIEWKNSGFKKFEDIIDPSSIKYSVGENDIGPFLKDLQDEYNNKNILTDENNQIIPKRKAQALTELIKNHQNQIKLQKGEGSNKYLIEKIASLYPKKFLNLVTNIQERNPNVSRDYLEQAKGIVEAEQNKIKRKILDKNEYINEKRQIKTNIKNIMENKPKEKILKQIPGDPVIKNINYDITGAGKVPDYVAQGMDAINRELIQDYMIPPTELKGERYVNDYPLHSKHLQDFQNNHSFVKLKKHRDALDNAHKVYTASLNPGRYDELDKGLDKTVSPSHHAELRNEYEAPLKEKFNQLNEQLKKNVSFTAGSIADTYARRFIKGGGRNHTAAASLEQRLQEKMLSKDLKHRRRLIEDAHHKTMAYAQNAQNQELSASQLKSANKQAKEKADLLNLQSVSALHNEHEQNDLNRMDAEKKLSQDAVTAQQRDIEAQIIENERPGAEKQRKLVQAASIIQGVGLPLPEVRQPPAHPPSAFNLSQAPYQSRSKPQGGSGWENAISGAAGEMGPYMMRWENAGRGPAMGRAKGGRVHKSGGGVLREAIDNAYLNHISSLQSLNNLERANILDGGRDKKAEGGSPIDRGSRIADKYAQQAKREALAKKLESPEEKGLLELLARGFFKGVKDSGSNFLGAAPHAITAGFEENDKAEQTQLQKQLKAEELQSQFAKELQHEEEVAEAIRQKEQDHALHLRKQAHDEAYQGQHLAQMREDKMERYLSDKEYRQAKLEKEDRAYELAKQKLENELSPEKKAEAASIYSQKRDIQKSRTALKSKPTGGIMGKLNTGFGLFDDTDKRLKQLDDEERALNAELSRIRSGNHPEAHDLTTTDAVPAKKLPPVTKEKAGNDNGEYYKAFMAKYAGGRVG